MRFKESNMRIAMTVFGVILAGFSVGMFRHSMFGTDPFQVLCAGLNNIIPLSFGTFYMLLNIVLLVAMFLLDKHYIGLGTFVNIFILGYVAQWSTELWMSVFPNPSMVIRIMLMCVGIVILCLASSLYITSDMGVSTYDVWALWLGKNTKIPFKVWRVITDCSCILIGWLLGGVVGVGTVITAFFMGPLIDLFNRRVSQPLLSRFGSV